MTQHKNLEDEKITLYSFRHTFATMSMEECINARIAADIMGHKKPSLLLDRYSHVTDDEVYEKTAKTLDGAFIKYFNQSHHEPQDAETSV